MTVAENVLTSERREPRRMGSLTDDLGDGDGPWEDTDRVGDLFPPRLGNFTYPVPLHQQHSPHQNERCSDPWKKELAQPKVGVKAKGWYIAGFSSAAARG